MTNFGIDHGCIDELTIKATMVKLLVAIEKISANTPELRIV
jgi:hypothetical protein